MHCNKMLNISLRLYICSTTKKIPDCNYNTQNFTTTDIYNNINKDFIVPVPEVYLQEYPFFFC